jgi:hypothetical protein
MTRDEAHWSTGIAANPQSVLVLSTREESIASLTFLHSAPAEAGLGIDEYVDSPGMRYQTHSASPILSNLILKLDVVGGNASCGIAPGSTGDNDQSALDGEGATVHEVSNVPPANPRPAFTHLPRVNISVLNSLIPCKVTA